MNTPRCGSPFRSRRRKKIYHSGSHQGDVWLERGHNQSSDRSRSTAPIDCVRGRRRQSAGPGRHRWSDRDPSTFCVATRRRSDTPILAGEPTKLEQQAGDVIGATTPISASKGAAGSPAIPPPGLYNRIRTKSRETVERLSRVGSRKDLLAPAPSPPENNAVVETAAKLLTGISTRTA